MDNVKIIENTRQAKDEYGYMWGSGTFYLTREMIEALLMVSVLQVIMENM